MTPHAEAEALSPSQESDGDAPVKTGVRARAAERLAQARSGDTAIRALLDFVLPFLLVTYLGIREGGFDVVVRGEVGVLLLSLIHI